MATRRCLKIPFVVSATSEAAIIGNSCVENPTWEVPCLDLDFDAVACSSGAFPPTVFVPAALEEAVSEAVTLYAPSLKVVVVL